MARMDDIKVIWDMIKADLYNEIGNTIADIFFSDLEVTEFDGVSVTLSKNSDFHVSVLTAKYKSLIEEKFQKLLGIPIQAVIVSTENTNGEPWYGKATPKEPILENLLKEAKDAQGNSGAPVHTRPIISDSESDGASAGAARVGSTMPPFNFEYTFDNFIVGSSNKFAHAACLAVATFPAQSYNPLFVYGPSGLGKTHMLYAITNKLKDANPDVKVIYIKGEDFTNQMIDSLSRQAMKEFRDKYRSCDVLLIDDIQFIAGKVSTQEEFFHTFNALYENGKQIILTSDRPPREIKTLEDRLVTRFEWGLIADVQPPDLELRTAIIKKKAEQVNVNIPDDVLSFLAENLRSNIRQIEGAIKKLGAKSFITGCEITMELARGCISELLGGSEPLEVTVDKIFTAVYKKYNVKKEDIIGKSRTKETANARHITAYLLLTVAEMTRTKIGKLLDRDHTTVISSLDAVEKRKQQDPIFDAELREMIKDIKGQ